MRWAEERVREPGEPSKVSSLGYAIDRMSEEEVQIAASTLTRQQVNGMELIYALEIQSWVLERALRRGS